MFVFASSWVMGFQFPPLVTGARNLCTNIHSVQIKMTFYYGWIDAHFSFDESLSNQDPFLGIWTHKMLSVYFTRSPWLWYKMFRSNSAGWYSCLHQDCGSVLHQLLCLSKAAVVSGFFICVKRPQTPIQRPLQNTYKTGSLSALVPGVTLQMLMLMQLRVVQCERGNTEHCRRTLGLDCHQNLSNMKA